MMSGYSTAFTLENFIRVSHYFATIPSTSDFYSETATVLERFFSCDMVCFIKDDGGLAIHFQNRKSENSYPDLLDSTAHFVENVFSNGFLSVETVRMKNRDEVMLIMLPVNLFNKVESVMCVGYVSDVEPDKDVLNILLGISSMLGKFLEKQSTEHSFEALHKEHQRILSVAGEGIMGIDAEGRHTFVNPVAAQLLGYDVDEMIGKMSHELWHYKHKDGSPFDVESCKVHSVYTDGMCYSSSDECFIRKDGSSFPAEVTITPIVEDEKIGGAVIVFKDITERKQIEAALQQAHDELEEKVASRTIELKEANDKLKELDKMKSMFIASMSHELRTPLNSIIGFSGVILKEMVGTINEKQHDYMMRIKLAGEHLLMMIADVIDISKIEAGRIETIPETFHLKTLIDEALNEMRILAKKKGLTLEASVDESIDLFTDRRRVFQCLLNYLGNAIKFTETGGIILKAETFDETVKISVRDTGI
ncbi:MAG: PAS domain S-box protein, partial [Sulfurimonadaceae bacterium]|nr:PAS domain S-box protein [Sulfurimonadaceae bacterium]